MPAHKTKAVWRSQTHEDQGFNEIAFEDQNGIQTMFFHAQKDQTTRVLTNVVSLPIMARPACSVPICPDIAAFSRSVPAGGSQDIATEQLNGQWFDGKTLFYVRGETLGFAVPSGAVAIVEAEAYPGRDRNLVIARQLFKAPGSLGFPLPLP